MGFVYQREQDATYFYINAVPQFQSFNAGNWRFLEEGARDLAKSLNRNILTYTGTHELLTYNGTEIYLWYKKGLSNRKNGKRGKSEVSKGLPAPKYYWKIVYDEQEHQGVGFLGLNDPYAEDLEEKGHITCCTIEELASIVGNVESFETDSGKTINDGTPLLTCSLECDESETD